MRQAKELTNEQKQFIEDNWQSMTVVEIIDNLDLRSNYKVYKYAKEKGLTRYKKEFSFHEKQFIRNNYLKMRETEMVTVLGCTRFYIQKFKREEGLVTNRWNQDKKKTEDVFFNVDEFWAA